MTEVMHADIFFFITAITVIVVGVGMVIVLYYAIGILSDVRVVARKIRAASDELKQDFEELRANIKNEGVRVRTIFEMALGFIARLIPKTRSRKKKEGEKQE